MVDSLQDGCLDNPQFPDIPTPCSPLLVWSWSMWPTEYVKSDAMPLPRWGCKKKNGFCLRLPSWIACSRKAICFPVSSTMEKPVGQRTEVSKPQAHGRACKQILHPHLRLSWMQTQQTPRLKFCEAPWTRTTSVSHSQIPYPQKSRAIHFFMLLHLLIYMQQITYRMTAMGLQSSAKMCHSLLFVLPSYWKT